MQGGKVLIQETRSTVRPTYEDRVLAHPRTARSNVKPEIDPEDCVE